MSTTELLTERTYGRCLAGLFVWQLVVGILGATWGLPNGNTMWAADSVAPMTPLGVAYHVFVEHGFDSGYFYFKYPVGHQLVLAAVCAPVVAVAALTGNLSGIASDYPYGFGDPETFLTALALVMRTVSAFLAAGVVVLVGGIARRCGGSRAGGLMAALVAAGSYPLVFYAHTSNVETAYLFWAILALYAAIRGIEGDSPRWFWILGGSAAMAVSTKEQIAGFVALLPLLILATHWRDHRAAPGYRPLPTGTVNGALISTVVLGVVNAAFFNPSGFLNRYRYLTHTLSPEVRARYAAYEMPIDFSTQWSLADEASHLLDALRAVASSLGWPACVLGFAGLVWMVKAKPRGAVYVLTALVGYYVVSLRVLKIVEIRYSMPLSTLLAVPAGVLLAHLWSRIRPARPALVALLAGGLVYSTEVVAMLLGDARYAAEKWMAPRLAQGRTVEVYQPWTYLPRWTRTPGVTMVPFDEISVGGLRERAPDFVVLSSKGKEGITMYPNPDWRDGRGMMLTADRNLEFLTELEGERIGYRPVERFEHRPLFDRVLITSLNPSITVYQRSASP